MRISAAGQTDHAVHYKNDRREIKHIGCKRFGVQYLLKGIYVHNDLLYFHLPHAKRILPTCLSTWTT